MMNDIVTAHVCGFFPLVKRGNKMSQQIKLFATAYDDGNRKLHDIIHTFLVIVKYRHRLGSVYPKNTLRYIE